MLLVDKLGKAELEQIKYWKPTTAGDIIFNFWDSDSGGGEMCLEIVAARDVNHGSDIVSN